MAAASSVTSRRGNDQFRGLFQQTLGMVRVLLTLAVHW
jgi:hypothetical protein